jgi:hypothetical protein
MRRRPRTRLICVDGPTKSSKVLLQPTSIFQTSKKSGGQAQCRPGPSTFFEVGGPTEIRSLYVVLIGYETSKLRKNIFSE